MKRISKIAIALVLIIGLVLIAPLESVNAQFSDLYPTHWCYPKIMDFYERGYVDGYEDGTFLADDTITRAEYVKIVNNFFGYSKGDVDALEFSDLEGTEWFAPYVAEAVSRGYIEGYDDGTFKPQNPIRRQEATVILSRILNIHNETYSKDHKDGMAQYTDGDDIDEWAYKAVHSYSVHNFINGYPDQTIRLKKNVTRAETVELLNLLEQKIEIDRPSGGGGSSKPTVKKPLITVVEENNDVEWYNKVEAGEDGKVTVQVHTDTFNAVINVKVNGEVVETRNAVVEKGTTVEFDLADGKYEITANATKKGSKPSAEADSKTVIVDTIAPIAKGENTENGAKIEVIDPTTLTTDISGVNEASVKYAWFIKIVDAVSSEESYVRPTWSEWTELPDEVVLPETAEPGEYYLGIMASDNAGNKTTGNIDKYVSILPESGAPTITEGEEEYIIVIEKDKDDIEDPVDPENPTEPENPINPDAPVVPEEPKPVVVKTKHTIVFESEEHGKIEGTLKYENIEYGTEFSEIIVPTTTPDEGYSFAGWNPELPEADAKVIDDAEYTATWTINSYDLTINYVYEDGKEAAATYTDEVNYNEAYSVASPEIEGYTADVTTVEGTMGTEAVEVTVTYTINSYDLTINYVYKDGKEAAATYTDKVNYNEAYSVTSPEIEGYTADVTTVEGTMGTQAVEVTVTYTINSYDLTINYVYENGKEAAETYEDEVNYNEAYSVASPEIEGYTADVTTVEGTMGTQAVEVTVTYTINNYNLTINYVYKDGKEAAATYTDEVNYNEAYSVTSPEIEGYTAGITIVEGIMGTQPVEVTVTYAINSYDLTINYVYENGKEAAETFTDKVNYNEAYSVTSPQIEGYTADVTTVEGTMGTEAVIVTVTYKVNSYDLTINYEYEDGTEAAKPYETDVEYNKDYKVTSPEIEGYTPSVEIVTGTMSTDPVEVKVVYTKNSYNLTINYVYKDKTEAAPTYTGTVKYEESYNVESPTIKGYSADKLTVSGTMPADDVEVTVTYKVNSYDLTINYEYEDGTEAAKPYETDVEYNKDYKVASPEIEGYTPSVEIVTGTMSTDPVEVKVVYTKNSYNLIINYVYKDKTEAAPTYTGTVKYKESYNVESPSVAGYTADKLTVSGTMPADDVEVTVTYKVNSYDLTINYVYEDGTEAAKTYEDEVEFGEEYSVKSPTIKGYTADKTTVTGTMSANDVEVTVTYAVNKYTVYFDEDGGVEVENLENVSYGETINVSNISTTKTGYIFKGWKKGTSKVTEFTMPNEDVTLTAIWEWIEPDISIEKFVSTNYPDTGDAIKAEPGNTIEYELVVKNEEAIDVVISVDFNKNVTLVEPASLENITLKAGESITVKVKATVPNGYAVAENAFALEATVEAEFNGTTGDVDEATVENKIEKSSTTVLKNPEAKNIILVLDLSGSMNKGTNGKEDRIGALKVEAKKFVNKLQTDSVGEINLTLIGIGADDVNKYISGTLEVWSGYKNADAFILGSYTLNDWSKLITKIDGLVAYGGTNITGSMSIVNKILIGTKYRNKINYDENAKDYVVILTDGANGPNGDVAIKGTEDAIVSVRNNADYLAAIGFGSEASDTSKRAYKDLVSITNDVSRVYSAAKQTDLDKAFSDIANHIGKEQSVGGYAIIDVTAYNGNIYPIRVTHKVGTTDVELFRINHPTTSVTWDDDGRETTTSITIDEDKVKINLSGIAFSDKEDLKIIIGESAAKYTATFILNNGEEAVIKTQEAGSALEAPTGLTNETYEFLGWTPEVPSTMPAEDSEYEAMWDTGMVLMMARPPVTEETEQDELVKLELPKANLEKLELAKKDKLVNAKLNKDKLTKIELNKDKLIKIDLEKSELVKSELEKIELPKANLEKIELVKPELQKIELEEVKLVNAELKKEELTKIDLEEVKLIGKKPTLLPEIEKTEE